MEQFELEECLTQKRQIIQNIVANNETQLLFIERQNMKGLQRLLREREALIDQFAAVEGKLTRAGDAWQQAAAWQASQQTIQEEQAAMLNSCKQVMQQAVAMRRQIAAELREIKAARLLKNNYAPSWSGRTAGRYLSING